MKESLSEQLALRTDALVWTETVLLAVINVVAFFGNLLTCYAVYRNQRLRTLPNMFVIGSWRKRYVMSIFCMPFSVATLFRDRWMFGESFCRFVYFAKTIARISAKQSFLVKTKKASLYFITRIRNSLEHIP